MWTIEKYKEIYARYEASGLSSSDFCMNERITRSRFYYWFKKYRKLQGQNISKIKSDVGSVEYRPTGQFIPLLVDSDSQKLKSVYPTKKVGKNLPALRRSSVTEPFMEIVYTSGTTVRLMGEKDIELVKTLIDICR